MILSAPDPALDQSFAASLLRLQRDAYRAQADLIGSDRLPALAADDVSLPAWRGRYLVAWRGTHLVGAVAWRSGGDEAEIDRVMVEPTAHRQGVAATLVRAVLAELGSVRIVTWTGRDNAPGIALYRRFGFEQVADEQEPGGLWITRLRRS
jgi:ribosomal protein S18 acetylase RimI-like enzyme